MCLPCSKWFRRVRMEDPPPQAEAVGAKEWRCDQCPAIFGRLDHLKRHTVAHNTKKSHVCPFCGAVFGRGDVLRRHWKSCKTRIETGQGIPETQRGGKHKRACDSCANLRKACNGETPCAECRHRARPCTYQRLYEDEDPKTSTHVNTEQGNLPNDQILDMIETPDTQSSWGLGPQSFYPNTETGKKVYAHRRSFGI